MKLLQAAPVLLDWTSQRAQRMLARLARQHPESQRGTALRYRDPYQLAVSVMLSAQCTDARVNQVSGPFFSRFPDFVSLAAARLVEVEDAIRSVGLFRTKAANLVSMARIVTEKHRGRLPCSVEALLSLPGIGRKSANVIVSELYDTPALAVDTHVGRVARRLGWSASKSTAGVERDVTSLLPRQQWNKAHRVLIWHGRKLCRARKPDCHACSASLECHYYLRRES